MQMEISSQAQLARSQLSQAQLSKAMMSFGAADEASPKLLNGQSDATALDNQAEDLKKVAQEFESLFMNMMLKSMRAANRAFSEGNYFDSFEGQMYEDMLDEKLSVEMSKSHGLGIADLLVSQLTPQKPVRGYNLMMGPKPPAAEDPVTEEPVVGEIMPLTPRITAFNSPDEFVATILPKAKAAAKSLGIDASLLVSQAALETGWGKHIMTNDQGDNSHNLFGIKTNSAWQGGTVAKDSLEVRDGIARKERSIFKSYPSYADALNDYADLIGGNDRYQDVVNSGSDMAKFGSALKQGGYATDPDYDKKLLRIVDHPSIRPEQSAAQNEKTREVR